MASKSKSATSQNAEPPKIGRPVLEITVERVRDLAAADLTVTQLCLALEISTATLYRRFEENPLLREAFEHGREYGNTVLLRRAMQMAMKGDSGMMRFLLKNREPRYREVLTLGGRVDIFKHGMNEDELAKRLGSLKRDPDVLKYLSTGDGKLLIGEVANGNSAGGDDGDAAAVHSRTVRADSARRISEAKTKARKSNRTRSAAQRKDQRPRKTGRSRQSAK